MQNCLKTEGASISGAPRLFEGETPAHNDDLESIEQKYLLLHPEIYGNAQKTKVNDTWVLSFTFSDAKLLWHLDIEMIAGKQIQVKMIPKDPNPRSKR